MNNKPQIIGHRGAKGLAPENTLTAFKKAIELGISGVELDLHCCASGELVVIHDHTLERTTNGTGYVHLQPYSYLKNLIITPGEKIPTLQEILPIFPPNFLINLEIKTPNVLEPLIALLKKVERKKGTVPYLITSFDHVILKKLKQALPTVEIGIATVAILVNHLQYAKALGCRHVVVSEDFCTLEWVETMQKSGLSVWIYTVNGVLAMKRFARWGVDGIITDYPDQAQVALCS